MMPSLLTCLLLFISSIFTNSCTSINMRYPASDETYKVHEAHTRYRELWLQSHDHKALTNLLEFLELSEKIPPMKDYRYLKEVRKNANLYRLSFSLFSVNGHPPKKFNSYVKHFGKLNDAIDSKSVEKMKKEAKWLRSWLEKNNVEEVGLKFKPLSPNQLREKLIIIVDDLRLTYKKKMTQHALHEFRKKLKLILQIYYYSEVSNKKVPKTGKKLDKIVIRLGDIHDDYVISKLSPNETETIEVIKISSKERDKVLTLLEKSHTELMDRSCSSLISQLFI